MKKKLFVIIFILFTISINSQNIDMELALADDFFRNGVSAFHNGYLNKAYLNFEQALSRKPNNNLYNYWLAETYYRNGYNSNATEIWSQLISNQYKVDFLSNRLEQVRRMVEPKSNILDVNYTISKELSGYGVGLIPFIGPISIAPELSGGFYATSYISGDIIHFNANGLYTRRIKNGLISFNRIFDILNLEDGSFLVTESGVDRVIRYSSNFSSKLGQFGEKGRGENQFLGPQFLAEDDDGYIYISDVGNNRVCKYTKEGEYVLQFGHSQSGFKGLELVTGLSTIDNIVLVADKRQKVIFVFDKSGNYITELARGKFKAPEGITRISKKEFLVADDNRLVLFDMEVESVNIISDFDGLADRIIKADIDLNGNIIVSDFNKNVIYYLTDRSLVYSGLFIQVEQIINDNYPNVYIDFTVKDSLGRPFCGLNDSNFLLKENGSPITDSKLIYSDVESEDISISFLLDRSSELSNSIGVLESAMRTFFTDLIKGDYFALISQESIPIMEDEILFKNNLSGKTHLDNVEKMFINILDKNRYNIEDGRFDLGIRESVNRLLKRRGKKAIIYLTDGKIGLNDFKEYNLTRLENYLVNNNIIFYYVKMTTDDVSSMDDLEYLAQKTGGIGLSIFSPKGVSNLIPALRKTRNGRYVLQYKSKTNDDFGRNYLSTSIELTHFNRTGKSVFGYYSPLDFN